MKKIKVVIVVVQIEKFVNNCLSYAIDYDHLPHPKGYSIPIFNNFDGNGNPK